MDSDRQSVLRKLAAANWLATRARKVLGEVRAEAAEMLEPGDRTHARLDDGGDMGTISMTNPAPAEKMRVQDMDQFALWLSVHHPEALTQRPADWALAESQLASWTDANEGELPAGVVMETVTRKPTLTVRQTADQSGVVEGLWAANLLPRLLEAPNSDTEEGEAK